jgi:hypothetical protein
MPRLTGPRWCFHAPLADQTRSISDAGGGLGLMYPLFFPFFFLPKGAPGILLQAGMGVPGALQVNSEAIQGLGLLVTGPD